MQNVIEEMSLEEKIGQLIMVAFNQDTLNGDIITLIKHYYIGGVLLQLDDRMKSKRLSSLNKYLQYYASVDKPLIIANELRIDKYTTQAPVTAMPSEQFFHKLNNRLYTRQLAEVIGQELHDVGINAIMSPNLHIEDTDDLRNKVDPYAYHGLAMIQGLRNSNVVSFVTGFPSSDEIDSFVKPDRRKSNLYPFYEVIKKGVDVLTISEISERLIDEQIRRNLQYENVIAYRLADNFTSAEDVAEQVIHAINKGINFVILPFTFRKQVDILNRVIELAKLGMIDELALSNSLVKLFSLKEKYNMNGMKPFKRPLTAHQMRNIKEKVVSAISEKVEVVK